MQVGDFVKTSSGKLGRVEGITDHPICPIRVKFESKSGNWELWENWGKEGVYNSADKFNFLCSSLNFYTVSVSSGSIKLA